MRWYSANVNPSFCSETGNRLHSEEIFMHHTSGSQCLALKYWRDLFIKRLAMTCVCIGPEEICMHAGSGKGSVQTTWEAQYLNGWCTHMHCSTACRCDVQYPSADQSLQGLSGSDKPDLQVRMQESALWAPYLHDKSAAGTHSMASAACLFQSMVACCLAGQESHLRMAADVASKRHNGGKLIRCAAEKTQHVSDQVDLEECSELLHDHAQM